jgi:hypothetical protein
VRAKIFLFPGESFKPALRSIIDEDQLPIQYGGTLMNYSDFRAEIMSATATATRDDEEEDSSGDGDNAKKKKKKGDVGNKGYEIERSIYNTVRLLNKQSTVNE